MKKTIITLLGLGAAIFALSSCKVDKTAEGEMPSVDVDVEGDAGKMPEYDVKGPEVETGTKKIDIPDKIEVPTIDVEMPGEDEGE